MLLLLQESGLARVLLPELGLETVMRINRPAKPGDTLQACVGFVDVPQGIYKLDEADFFTSVSLSSSDLEADDDASDASSQTPDSLEEAEATDYDSLQGNGVQADAESETLASSTLAK